MTNKEDKYTDIFYKELIGKYVKYEDIHYRIVGVREISNEQVLEAIELCSITSNNDELSSSGFYLKKALLHNVDRNKLSVITKADMLEAINKKVNVAKILYIR